MDKELHNNWEERFEKEFRLVGTDERDFDGQMVRDELKDFIKTVEKEAYERGKEEITKESLEKILLNIEPYKTWIIDHKITVQEARKEEREAWKKKVLYYLMSYKNVLASCWELHPVQAVNAIHISPEQSLRNAAKAIEDKRELEKGLDDLLSLLSEE